MEVHDDPDNAKSDPATVWPLDEFEALLQRCRRLADVVRGA
jgi:3-deoxy-D-manno-octulosonic acid (KDO) 8-phosphate synthase